MKRLKLRGWVSSLGLIMFLTTMLLFIDWISEFAVNTYIGG